MNKPEMYGQRGTAVRRAIWIAPVVVVACIAAAIPGNLALVIFRVLLVVTFLVANSSRLVVAIEVTDQYIHIHTMLRSFIVPLSDISKVRERWNLTTDICVEGHILPYIVSWNFMSLQEIQDVTDRLRKLINQ